MSRTNPCTRRDGTSKQRWPNRDAAEFAASWERLRNGSAHAVYECPGCGGWHVTTDRSEDQSYAARRKRKRNEVRRIKRLREQRGG